MVKCEKDRATHVKFVGKDKFYPIIKHRGETELCVNSVSWFCTAHELSELVNAGIIELYRNGPTYVEVERKEATHVLISTPTDKTACPLTSNTANALSGFGASFYAKDKEMVVLTNTDIDFFFNKLAIMQWVKEVE